MSLFTFSFYTFFFCPFYISRDGSVIFTVLFGTFFNLMYCMVVFYVSAAFTTRPSSEALEKRIIFIINKLIFV